MRWYLGQAGPILGQLKDYGTIEITLKSGFKFLIARLAFEILKDKDMTKK